MMEMELIDRHIYELAHLGQKFCLIRLVVYYNVFGNILLYEREIYHFVFRHTKSSS